MLPMRRIFRPSPPFPNFTGWYLLLLWSTGLHNTPLPPWYSFQIDRLAYADAARKSAQLDGARQAEADAHPFRPKIDAISARLARSKTDGEMAADARGRARREEAAAAWRAREEEGCTFRPRVSAAMAERVPGRLHPADQVREFVVGESFLERGGRPWPSECGCARPTT
jgi:hypothetical protein